MVTLSHTNYVERALGISEPYLKPTTLWVGASTARGDGSSKVTNAGTCSPHGPRKCQRTSSVQAVTSLTVRMARGPRVSDYHELHTVRDASTMHSALPGRWVPHTIRYACWPNQTWVPYTIRYVCWPNQTFVTRVPFPRPISHKKPVLICTNKTEICFCDLTKIWSSDSDSHKKQPQKWKSFVVFKIQADSTFLFFTFFSVGNSKGAFWTAYKDGCVRYSAYRSIPPEYIYRRYYRYRALR